MPFYLQPSLEFDFVTLKDINWYYKPKGVPVDNFINEDFDVLIDLVTNDCLPMEFLQALAHARFKVGKYNEDKKDVYDLMINVKEVKNINYLIEQVHHYLTIINRKEEHAAI